MPITRFSLKEFSITDGALSAIIQTYTREAGVRSLERELMKVARKAVTEILKGRTGKVEVTAENINDYLGVPRYRHGEAERTDQVGVVTGLAWTEVGGEPSDDRRRHDARQGPHDGDRQPARR